MNGYNGQSWIDFANSINQALVLAHFQFTRGQESEADAFGISLMSRAKYMPDAASEVWRQFIEEGSRVRLLERKNIGSETSPGFQRILLLSIE